MGGWARHCAGFIATAAALLLGACASSHLADGIPTLPQNQRCQLSDDDRRWLGEALAGWRIALRGFLRAPYQPVPQVVTYDSRCSYTLAAPPASPRIWTVAEHRGEIALPNGGKIPPAPNAFNAVTDAGHNFGGHCAAVDLEAGRSEERNSARILSRRRSAPRAGACPSVRSHSRHLLPGASEAIADDREHQRRQRQEAFEKNAAYASDYEAESDLLFRAASAPTDAEARALACDALAALRARRARHFTGSNAHWRLVDEMSLTTEGLGQWVAYKWLTQRRRLAPSLGLSKLRGPFWSQEQGLATFLIVDRLVPGWQRRLFSPTPATAEHLLALACRRQEASRPSSRRSTGAASAAR